MKTKRVSLNRYQGIGIREEWVKTFLRKSNSWFTKNYLGKAQFKSALLWLRDFGLIEKKESFYVVSKELELLSRFNSDSLLLWEIIWINIFYNSNLISLYAKNFGWGTYLTKKDFIKSVKLYYPHLSEKTIGNSFNSIINTFENSPLGNTLKIGVVEKVGRERVVKKIGTDNVHPIAILYSLYRYAISKNRYRLTISELYREDNKDGGPYLLFGISRNTLENILRWLSDKYRKYIYVEIIADLDNINLCEDIKDHTMFLEGIWKD